MSVVNNTGVNYSLYYNVLDYFKTIMVNHPQIESVSQGDLFSIDDNAFTLAAVKYNGFNIQFVLDKFKTNKEIVLAAVEQTGLALEFVVGMLLVA